MKVSITKLNKDAVLPAYSRDGDAGLDITATGMSIQEKYIEYTTGIAMAIPEGHVGLIFPRSSISNKELLLSNCVGVIDSNYRGEIKFRFKYNEADPSDYYSVGDRVGQIIIMPYPKIEFVLTDQLPETNRGSGGFGSSGN